MPSGFLQEMMTAMEHKVSKQGQLLQVQCEFHRLALELSSGGNMTLRQLY